MANASAVKKLEYADRFGHTWAVSIKRPRGAPKSIVFTCGDVQLIVTPEEWVAPSDLTPAELKEVFCDAERVFTHEKEKWYVGYRTRTGRGGVQAGMCTRFRNEEGEIRNSKAMLLFRTMTDEALKKHLMAS